MTVDEPRDDEGTALVPVVDLIDALRERPYVPASVAGLIGCGVVLRLLVVVLVGRSSGNPAAGLLIAFGLVPFALLAASVPLQWEAPSADLRTAARIWRWLEAIVAGTVPHVVLVAWIVRATAAGIGIG